MADEAEINFLAKEPVEVAQSPISTTAPSSSSSCTHPMAKPPAKRNVGDLTLLSILLMGENGKKAMEALREADKRVVRFYSIHYSSVLTLSFHAAPRYSFHR